MLLHMKVGAMRPSCFAEKRI